jgi:hypothetical protein
MTTTMGRSGSDLGRRVELVSMDRHHRDISIGLYLREGDEGPVASVHSFSGTDGVDGRLEYLVDALCLLGGLERAAGERSVRFPCRSWHNTAAKRLFAEACKHDPATPLEQRPLEAPDSRSDQTIVVEPLGDGAYEVKASGATEDTPSRAPAIARGIAKLAQLSFDDGERSIVTFACGQDHDALIGLLLLRAQNLRQVLREEEMEASKGVLAAPSQQE